jgi:hypothetical protein
MGRRKTGGIGGNPMTKAENECIATAYLCGIADRLEGLGPYDYTFRHPALVEQWKRGWKAADKDPIRAGGHLFRALECTAEWRDDEPKQPVLF